MSAMSVRSLFALIPAAVVLAAPLSAHANLDLAKKYDGQKDAADAQAALSDADARTLATWVLGGAK